METTVEAQGPVDVTVRARFEEWYSTRFTGGSIANMPMRSNGEYVSAQQEIAWQSWNAATAETRKTCEVACAQAIKYARGSEREHCLAPLFDGWLVYSTLDEKARARTSAENVTDTLDAYARLIKMRSNDASNRTPR